MNNVMNKSKIREDISVQDKSISFISENIIINGSISSNSGSVEVLGQVNGDCNIANLTVRESGIINGNVSGSQIKIRGTINGNIKADAVKVFANAKIIGDIVYNTLSIEDGATLNGTCKRADMEKSNISNEK